MSVLYFRVFLTKIYFKDCQLLKSQLDKENSRVIYVAFFIENNSKKEKESLKSYADLIKDLIIFVF